MSSCFHKGARVRACFVAVFCVLLSSAASKVLPLPPASAVLKEYGNPFGVSSYFGEFSSYPYPVPTPPNGRSDVHGWLILPIACAPTDKIDGVHSTLVWLSHHVPEFYEQSPHNFQMVILAVLNSTAHIPDSPPDALQVPLPQLSSAASYVVGYEYTITPPPPFSLNDMLERRFYQLNGVVYYGSFDTTERSATNLGQMEILSLSTANWLNSSTDIPSLAQLTYFSYPLELLQGEASGTIGLYLAHTIISAAAPDFDQVVHVNVAVQQCQAGSMDILTQALQTPGLQWSIPARNNTLDDKLKTQDMADMQASLAGNVIVCHVNVVESIHCASGLGFDKNCNN